MLGLKTKHIHFSFPKTDEKILNKKIIEQCDFRAKYASRDLSHKFFENLQIFAFSRHQEIHHRINLRSFYCGPDKNDRFWGLWRQIDQGHSGNYFSEKSIWLDKFIHYCRTETLKCFRISWNEEYFPFDLEIALDTSPPDRRIDLYRYQEVRAP